MTKSGDRLSGGFAFTTVEDSVKNQNEVDDVCNKIYRSRYTTKKKKICHKSNVGVKYGLLTLFDICCGVIEIPPFQLSFPRQEEPGCYHLHLR